MKHQRFLAWLILLVLLTPLAGNVQAHPTPAPTDAPASDPPALVRVALPDPGDLDRFVDTGLPAYARLYDGHHSFLLAGANASGRQALSDAGLSFQIIDPSPAGHAYYLAYLMPGQPQPDWNAFGPLLLDDDVQVLLRCSPEQAENLAMAGAEIRQLQLVPKPLQPAPAPRAYPTVIDPDPLIQSMIDQVVSTTVYQYDGDLSGEWPVDIGGTPYTIVTRHTNSGTPIQMATQFAGQHLANLGLTVEYHQWGGATYPNVIGELTGQTNPDDIYILCAHIDDMPPGGIAPGADDNASGVVAVLMAADILTQYNWGCTLRFALWTGEEQGLNGSAAYALRSYQAGENILGVLNLDMIAYNTIGSSPDIDLHADQNGVPPSMDLAQLFADVVDAYNLDLIPEIVPNGTGASDHASFWDYGYTAILGIEDFSDFNPHYHTVNDLLSNTDIEYFTEFVKASIGTFVHMGGCLIPGGLGYLDGTVSAAGTGLPIQDATVTAADAAGHTFPASTDAAGYYTRTLLSGTYTVTAAAYGYLSTTVTGVTILTDTVTTQNFSLTSSSTYIVSGTVTEAGSGLPLLAQIAFQGSPITATTDPNTGFYSASLPLGNYTMQVSADRHQPQERLITLDHDQTQHFALEPLPCILLVDDDDNDPDVLSYYTAALDNMGYDYDVFDVGAGAGNGPELGQMMGYEMIVWFSGDQYAVSGDEAGPNATDETNLAAYLDAGGRLFLSSQDYLYDMGLTSFGGAYLGIDSFENDNGNAANKYGVSGDPIGDGLGPYTLSYPIDFNDYGDIVDPAVGASTAFRSGPAGGNNLDVDKDGGAWKTVFFGTSWVPIYNQSAADGEQVLQRIIDWFDACAPCIPVSNTQFIWSPITPTVGQTTLFSGTADGDLPILYQWSFGDGDTAMGPLTAHAYDSAGDYQVLLSTTNACGEMSVAHTLTVQALPCNPVQIQEVLTTVNGCTVTYAAVLTGTTPYTYNWDLGALGNTASPTATVNYVDSGTYPFTLSVINGCGQDVQTGTVTVDCTPPCEPVQNADFGWEPLTPTIEQPITLTAWVGGIWLTETVDSNLGPPGTFGYNALALDAAGRPHVAYYEHLTQSGDLKYAYHDGLTWQIETVDAAGDVGAYPSLALDDMGRPHVSYANESGSGGLKYAWHDGTVWLSETVQADRPGYHTSLVLDTQGDPHISYLSYDWSTMDGDLNYAWHDGSAWQIETVDGTGSTGWYSSLALDDLGRPHISYRGNGLQYAYFDGTDWLTETVDPADEVAFVSIALDSTGRPHISYVSDGQLKYAHRNGTGFGLNQGWQIETVDGDVDWYTSLDLDSLERPHVSYYDQAGAGLKYAWHDGTHWRIETVDAGNPGEGVGQYNALALDVLGRPHISYYDSTKHDLKYTWRAATSTPPLTYTWDLGDDTLGTGEVTTHSYTLPGTYTVTLTASNPCGQATTQHRLVVLGQEQTWTLYLPLAFK